MPQVPYQGYPTEGVQDVPLRPDTPGAAFGVEGARAIAGAGREISGAGNQLFSEALRLKNLENETEANDADTKYTIEAGQLHASYNALQGDDRVKAFPKYQQDLQESRGRIRAGMSNDAARRMFDHNSLGTMHRSIFNGAGAAATALKEYSIGTATSQMEILKKEIMDDPTDEGAFQLRLQKMDRQAEIIAREKGLPPGSPQADLIKQDAQSEAWKHRIIGVNNVDPFRAEDMRQKAAQAGQLNPRDDEILTGKIKNQTRAIEGTNLGEKYYEDHPEMSPEQGRKDVREAAKAMRPDDPGFVRTAENAYIGRQRAAKYDEDQYRIHTTNDIKGAIVASKVKNLQELRAIPGMGDKIDSLKPEQTAFIDSYIRRVREARSFDENAENDHALRMMANDPKTRQKYIEADLSKYQLSDKQLEYHTKYQDQMARNPRTNTVYRDAFATLKNTMGPQLEALHVARLTTKPEQSRAYWKFQSNLSMAIDSFKEREGRYPKDREIIDEIGPSLLRKESTPGFLGRWLPEFPVYGGKPGETQPFTSTEQPFFMVKPSPAWKKSFKQSVIDAGGQEPTEQQYEAAYTRQRYNELYGKKESK